jgi:hypothetical protein
MSVCVSILTIAFDPQVVGALTDCLFYVLHLGFLLFVVLSEPTSHVSSREKAGGRYAAGCPELAAGSRARFRRFVSESINLDV